MHGIGQILDAALKLAADGMPVFPCLLDKRPATVHGFKNASVDSASVRELWHRYPAPLIGIPTGAASGFDILDLDFAKHPACKHWYDDNRYRLPDTRIHQTRSEGLHLLFRCDALVRGTTSKIAAGVDTRGRGNYAIWWPAVGLPVFCNAPLAPWPDWLLETFKPKPRHRVFVQIPNNQLLVKLVQMVAGAREGERNNLTFWCACRAGEMARAGLLSTATAINVIAEAATRAGLSRAEAQHTAKSGVKTGGGDV
jgi:hypothetical protein